MMLLAQLLEAGDAVRPAWEGGGTGSVLLVLLVLMAGTLAAGYIFIKRGSLPRLKGRGQLDLLETRMLGGRQFLVVARHGKQKFLLGVCPGRIDYLCPLDDEESAAGEAAEFAEMLRQQQAPEG